VAAAAAAVMGLMAQKATAQSTATWNGGNGNWNTSGNWDSGIVPNSGTTSVVIDGGNFVSSTVLLNGGQAFTPSINSLTVDAGDTLNIAAAAVGNPTDLLVNGNVTLNGTLGISESDLSFVGNAPASLAGTGSINLVGGNLAVSTASTGTLDIGPGVTIHGRGGVLSIPRSIVNHGTISASLANDEISVDGLQNSGTLEAVGGGTLWVRGVNNTGTINVGASSTLILESFGTNGVGTLLCAPSAHVFLIGTVHNEGASLTLTPSMGMWQLNGGTIIGGTIHTSDGATLVVKHTLSSTAYTGPAVFDGVTLETGPSGFTLANGEQLQISHGLTLAGGSVMNLAPGSALSFPGTNAQTLGGAGSLSFNGTGNVSFTFGQLNQISTIGAAISIHGRSASFNVQPNGEINSGGALNQGTIFADVPGGTFTMAHVTNSGTIANVAGSMLDVRIPFLQLSGVLNVNGSLSSGSNAINLQGGIFSGNGNIVAQAGSITANVSIGGKLSPGSTLTGSDSIGALSVTANVLLKSGSHYAAELSGNNVSDLVAISGTGAGGGLSIAPGTFLDLIRMDDPVVGSYVIATYTGSLEGAFDNITPGYGVSYATPHEIIVTSVPEPSATLLCAGALLQWRRRKRK
jgi:hypothetical protein